MQAATRSKKGVRWSLTDTILTLCSSGRFGVREAITKATTQSHCKKGYAVQKQGKTKKAKLLSGL